MSDQEKKLAKKLTDLVMVCLCLSEEDNKKDPIKNAVSLEEAGLLDQVDYSISGNESNEEYGEKLSVGIR